MRMFRRTRAALSRTWGAIRADVGLGIVGSPSPDSDYWYHGLGYRSTAGPNVSPGTATRLGAVFACTHVVSETVSSLPVGIYRERKGGGRDVASDHPALELFLYPNPWQTSMEFFETMQGHLELRGNAYAIKVPGNGRAIDQLTPVHPDRVRVFILPNGRLRYEVTGYSTGHIDRYSQDEILHMRGWSFDGVMGISTVTAMAEVIGVGLAQQESRGRSFHRPFPGMAIETVKMTSEAETLLKNTMAEGLSGENAFNAMLLPPGVKATPLSLTNKDQQLIEASAATRLEICAAWRVPPHKVGDLSRGTFSNIEQQNIEFATDCVRPRLVRNERRLDRDIVGSLRYLESASGDFFVTFNMDALFRGDMKSRYESYQLAVQTWMVRNEARSREGLNPIDGFDEPLVPVNLETIDQAQQRSDNATATANAAVNRQPADDANSNLDDAGGGAETPQQTGPEEDEQKARAKENLRKAHHRALALESAGRVVRREVKGLRKLDYAGKDFAKDLDTFYDELAPIIATTMRIPRAEASVYALHHTLVLTRDLAALNPADVNLAIAAIEEKGTEELASLALEAKGLAA